MTQVENILNLAFSSFESKNFQQAEVFCNQVIAMDATNYEAWKLKGEAINFQITQSNPRILEVYNCLMTSYRVLDDSEKRAKAQEVLSSLKCCLEGEVEFWVQQFENGRPDDEALQKVTSTYSDCYNKMASAYSELGFENSKASYLRYFANLFIDQANKQCVSAWKTTVAYNYYRDDLNNYGSNWKWNGWKDKSTGFRPQYKIWQTFLSEGNNLIRLLQYCEKQFNSETNEQTKINIYSNIAFYAEKLKNSCSFKAMVSTLTNEYGAVLNREEYWQTDCFVSDNVKSSYSNIVTYNNNKIAELKKIRIDVYWQQHSDDKKKLDSERDMLLSRIDDLKTQKSALGIFKVKEKKALQDQIDTANNRINAIDRELSRER